MLCGKHFVQDPEHSKRSLNVPAVQLPPSHETIHTVPDGLSKTHISCPQWLTWWRKPWLWGPAAGAAVPALPFTHWAASSTAGASGTYGDTSNTCPACAPGGRASLLGTLMNQRRAGHLGIGAYASSTAPSSRLSSRVLLAPSRSPKPESSELPGRGEISVAVGSTELLEITHLGSPEINIPGCGPNPEKQNL